MKTTCSLKLFSMEAFFLLSLQRSSTLFGRSFSLTYDFLFTIFLESLIVSILHLDLIGTYLPLKQARLWEESSNLNYCCDFLFILLSEGFSELKLGTFFILLLLIQEKYIY